jgi:hypothetical protein
VSKLTEHPHVSSATLAVYAAGIFAAFLGLFVTDYLLGRLFKSPGTFNPWLVSYAVRKLYAENRRLNAELEALRQMKGENVNSPANPSPQSPQDTEEDTQP